MAVDYSPAVMRLNTGGCDAALLHDFQPRNRGPSISVKGLQGTRLKRIEHGESAADGVPRLLIKPHTIGVHSRVSTVIRVGPFLFPMLAPGIGRVPADLRSGCGPGGLGRRRSGLYHAFDTTLRN
jgi:hypothetical protein